MLNTPVLLIIFNRPHTTRKVLDVLRQVQPRQLFVAADGPRSDHPDDEEKCKYTRAVVDEMVDWQCDVHKNYADENMGCGPRPATAITWFFENVERGIILEDDCVPHPTFFRFCEELLEYYKDNERVMHIGGSNFQNGRKRGNASYYFSIYTHGVSWATWRRAWQHFDFKSIPPEARSHIWDFQWFKAAKRQGGLAVLPNVNLLTNLGFDSDASHTVGASQHFTFPVEPMDFPVRHPDRITIDWVADRHTDYTVFRGAVSSWQILKMQIEDIIRYSRRRVTSFWR